MTWWKDTASCKEIRPRKLAKPSISHVEMKEYKPRETLTFPRTNYNNDESWKCNHCERVVAERTQEHAIQNHIKSHYTPKVNIFWEKQDGNVVNYLGSTFNCRNWQPLKDTTMKEVIRNKVKKKEYVIEKNCFRIKMKSEAENKWSCSLCKRHLTPSEKVWKQKDTLHHINNKHIQNKYTAYIIEIGDEEIVYTTDNGGTLIVEEMSHDILKKSPYDNEYVIPRI